MVIHEETLMRTVHSSAAVCDKAEGKAHPFSPAPSLFRSTLHCPRGKASHTSRSTQTHSPALPLPLRITSYHLHRNWNLWVTSATSAVAPSLSIKIQLHPKASFWHISLWLLHEALVHSSGFSICETSGNSLKWRVEKKCQKWFKGRLINTFWQCPCRVFEQTFSFDISCSGRLRIGELLIWTFFDLLSVIGVEPFSCFSLVIWLLCNLFNNL